MQSSRSCLALRHPFVSLHLGSASAALCLGLKPSALAQSHYFWLSVEVSA